MTDPVIPVRRVFELLRGIANDRGLRVHLSHGRRLMVMCAVCFPHQPERLPYGHRVFGRADNEWHAVLRDECEGYATLRFPRAPHPSVLIRVPDVLTALEVTSCCHDEDNALGGWYWRSDLEMAIDGDLEASGDAYAAEWADLEEMRREAVAQQDAIEAAYAAGSSLTLRQRVQAVAAVLKQDGYAVQVDQARVSWECDHVDHEGAIGRLIVIVSSEGFPRIGYESCTLHSEEEVLPRIDALGAEYRRVADMSPEERAAYKPVPEAKARGGGWPSRRGGSKPKAAPKPEWTVERTRAFFEQHGIDAASGIRVLETRAKTVGASDYPKRGAITAMKNAESSG